MKRSKRYDYDTKLLHIAYWEVLGIVGFALPAVFVYYLLPEPVCYLMLPIGGLMAGVFYGE